jgi:hypothetical protein
MSFKKDFIETTVKSIKHISVRTNQSFDKEKAKEYMQQSMQEIIPKAQKAIREDMKDASFGLNPEKPNRLMIEVGMVTYAYQARLWADDIFEHSKTGQPLN